MTIAKAQWNTDGDNVRLSMPFSKVDVERRIVSGFATLDNVDRQQDIVTAEASVKAFSKFRGNIREMHQPIAVGKMVNFKEDKYFDPETKKFYNGVYVSAYVSKGAQDTWEKVLDGTLSGFSIGGRMNKWDDAYDEKMDKTVRVIKEYDLVELSLVDTPANQFANILSVEKTDIGDTLIKGEIAETEIENVFWDDENGIVMISENESEISPRSGVPMKNIGFVEKSDSEKTDMVKFLVDSAKGINTEIKKEVSPMTDETTDAVAEAAEEVAVEAEVAPEAEVAEEAVEEVVVEAEAVEADAEKADTVDATEEVISKSDEVLVDAVAEIKDTLTSAFSDLADTVKSLNEQVSELKKSLDSVKNEVAETKGSFDEFGKRVDAVEADTAFRKSGDLGEIVQEVQIEKSEQSLWGGRFLKTADLFN
jgi:phage shock protein A